MLSYSGPDKIQQLNRLEHLLRVELKLKRGFEVNRGDVFNQEDNLKQAVEALQAMNNVGELSLVLTADDSRKREGWHGLGTNVRGLIRGLLSHHSKTSGLKTLKVKGIDSESHGREEINVLESLLIIKKQFIKLDGSKSVSSNDAFEKIVQAYNEKEQAISQAAELVDHALVLGS